RKKIEFSEQCARLAVDTAMLGTFDIDMLTGAIICSDRLYEIFGVADTRPSYADMVKQFHPDDLHIRAAAIEKAEATGAESVNYEVRIIWQDKSIHWVNIRGALFKDESKKAIRIFATVMDVTEHKNFLKKIQKSEKKFRHAITQAPVGIVILRGPEFIVETVNEAYLELIDKTEDNFVGTRLFDSLPEVKEAVEPLLNNVLKTGVTFNTTEFPVPINRYGTSDIFYFNFAYQALIEPDGNISGVIAVVNEVTSLVKAKHSLAETEKQFRNMMETIPQIAWTNTIDGEVIFYNQRWYDYTKLNTRQTKLKGLEIVIHPDDLQYTLDQNKQIRETSDGGEFQNRKRRGDGEYRWHLIRLMPIKNEDGEVQLWVGTATDIHELKLLQQQKDDFISIASHELKTPITSLKASLQLLNLIKDDPSSKMLPGMIALANKSLDKVIVLIKYLLDASNVNGGQLHLSQHLFTLSKVIDECCDSIKMEGKYTVLIEGNMELEVFADPERINQIVINFVNNAIKYAPESKKIVIHIEKIGNMAKVTVTDKGPGIAADKLSHLFDRYYRIDSSGNQYSGLGLGLYISSEIIKKHGGEIGVYSEVGKGSTFWFTLPTVVE
ncbi:MAG: PAS domain S-box protein, partial [Sphingobacteriales bacterium]|nr:PAS domain S-box protein [Sphingobacteriales bacterium]